MSSLRSVVDMVSPGMKTGMEATKEKAQEWHPGQQHQDLVHTEMHIYLQQILTSLWARLTAV